MLYACAARFDVTENLEKFLVFGEKEAIAEALATAQHHNIHSQKLQLRNSLGTRTSTLKNTCIPMFPQLPSKSEFRPFFLLFWNSFATPARKTRVL